MTREEAVELASTEWWKKATAVEIVRKQLFEERLIMSFGDFQLACEEVFEQPIWTHQFGSVQFTQWMKDEFIRKHGDD